MYDQSGMNPDDLVRIIERDWRILVDSMQITKDERYLHHEGKPIVGIFGYFPNSFSVQIAHQVAEIFKKPGYEAHIIASGERVDDSNPSWNNIYSDFLAYFPWNVGNYTSSDLNHAYAQTLQWPNERSILNSYGAEFIPLVFPGFGWDNLMNQPPGTTKFGRRKGEVLWTQIKDVVNISAKTVYSAMFDEIDESTAIFKITYNIPINHYYSDNEGLHSDFYLNLTGYASDIIDGEKTLPSHIPDFTAMSQPSIPDILSPLHLDTIENQVFTIFWSPSYHKSNITSYQIAIDGKIFYVGNVNSYQTSLSGGWHSVAVRAKNGLGNVGGWSESNEFYIIDFSFVQDQEFEKQVQLYPNLSGGNLNIINKSTEVIHYNLMNLSGQLMSSGQLGPNEKTIIENDQTVHLPGMAILKFTTTDGTTFFKKNCVR